MEEVAEDKLDLQDKVALQIGRIVRADVDLEFGLRRLFATLASGPALELAPGDLTGLNNACRDMMQSKAMVLSPQQKLIAKDVFATVTKAHAKRNRATHDMLMPRTDGSPGFKGIQFGPKSVLPIRRHDVDLDVLAETLSGLRSAGLRVMHLYFAIFPVDDDDVADDWAGARGEARS